MTRGEDAERLVADRLRAALPPEFRLYPNVEWTGPMRDGGPAEDGEADLVIAHPEHGLLVLEVKDGEPSRDAAGRWWLGPIPLDRSPFEQAMRSQHQLVRKLESLPAWPVRPGGGGPRTPHAGHGVAFPSVDMRSLPAGHILLGPDAPRETVLDAEALEQPEAIRAWIERAFDYFIGDGSKGWSPGDAGISLIEELLAPTVQLRRLVRGRIVDDAPLLLEASREQQYVLRRTRARRVEVIGPAGSGKSMLAAEKARRLAVEGYRTLLVCFNQRLATSMRADLGDTIEGGYLEVTTFHRLCEQLGREASMLSNRPTPIPQRWWDETLPNALIRAVDALPERRFHAIVVDEGQDFERSWLDTLDFLLTEPGEGTLWVFHDPGQALYRPDIVASLWLQRIDLHENWRNPGSVADLAARFYRGGEEVLAIRETEGLRHRVVAAEPGRETTDALRRVLHELVEVERVRPWELVVLSGSSAPKSEAWRTRHFGNVTLWNEAIADDGSSKGLPPEAVPTEPDDVVLFETVWRFKGLERPVVVLVELPEMRTRLDELLYVGLTRATTQLIVIAPSGLAGRMS